MILVCKLLSFRVGYVFGTARFFDAGEDLEFRRFLRQNVFRSPFFRQNELPAPLVLPKSSREILSDRLNGVMRSNFGKSLAPSDSALVRSS